MPDHIETIAEDLVYGAAAVARELRGADTPEYRRWVYYQARRPNNPFGLFRIGSRVCGRRSRFRRVGDERGEGRAQPQPAAE
jgi:hypothetical protein